MGGMIYKILARRTIYIRKTGKIETVWKEIVSARTLLQLRKRLDIYILNSKHGRKSKKDL